MIRNKHDTTPAPSENGAREEGESSRRNSTSSQMSSSTTSPNYDSGNISDMNICLRPASLSSAEDDCTSSNLGEENKFQLLLREKDQSLFLALQDARKLKSELERLSKSEKWYKTELRAQKNSKLEILEKLYTNERKFTQENQRLQNECIALYARCSDIENQLQEEKELSVKLLKTCARTEATASRGDLSRDFELEQLRQRLSDQEQLIEMLRTQKRTLLNDLQKLSSEKDEIVLQLQQNVAQLEEENRTITKKCMQLVDAKNALKDELLAKDVTCSGMSNTVLDLQIAIKSLEEKLHSQITELNEKEQELSRLKDELFQKDHLDKVGTLLERKYQDELSIKQDMINSLHKTISDLKTELTSQEGLRAHCDEQSAKIDKLNCLLEIEKYQNSKALHPNAEIHDSKSDAFKKGHQQLHQQNLFLQSELQAIKNTYEISSQNLELSYLRQTKEELEQLSEKYSEVCTLFEKSKFESEMKDITVEKFKFEKDKDAHEIETLRKKIVEVSRKFECQKSLTTEFEFALSRAEQERHRIESENKCNIDQNLKLRSEVSQSVQESLNKDLAMKDLTLQLRKVEDMLSEYTRNTSSNMIAATLCEKDNRESRISLIKRLLSHQTDKVDLLNAEQKEWEHLLNAVHIQNKSKETDFSISEFDNLNQLFDKQNSELMHINEINLGQVLSNLESEMNTFQKELETSKIKISTLNKQIEVLESSNADYQREIAHLAGTNERLIQEFNGDFTRERENHKKHTKQLKLDVQHRTAENDQLKGDVQILQSEINHLNISNLKYIKNLSEISGSDHQSEVLSKDVGNSRILQNVLETEHRRKMNRYDVHIRSLLSSVKSQKKHLENAENRYEVLLAKSKEMVDVDEMKAAENNLQKMKIDLECSQKEVTDLKYQLETLTEQFFATDANKGSNMINFTNLMDDYKKLIQQSQSATKRPSTAEIYRLINKSNNFVPKLTNVSTSIDGLREDIQQLCTMVNLSSPAGRGTPQRKMSLMDELKLAENGKLC